MSGLSHCAHQVRLYDRDRYRFALFAPPETREALFAVYAFNTEIARIPEIISEPLLGGMRLEWWREALAETFIHHPVSHPVLVALSDAVRHFDLDREPFDRLLDSRAFDMEDVPPPTMDDLLSYAEGTSATLSEVALTILATRNEAARSAARHVGIAWAMMGLIRAIPFHASARRVYLPADLCRKAGLDLESLFALGSSPELEDVVFEMAATASHHLSEARALRKNVPSRALSALLPAVLAERRLRQLRRARYNPFDIAIHSSRFGDLAGLLVAATFKRY